MYAVATKQAKKGNRKEFLGLLPEGGIGLELGIASGYYSRAMCDKSRLSKIYGIDRYTDHHDDVEMTRMLDFLKDQIAINRYTFLRGSFESHLKSFDDKTFDFIYIDGYAHTGQENGATLDDWWPKLKPGGTFAGHDYHEDYIQTIDAVDAFIDNNNLELHILEDLEDDQDYPSWYTFKHKDYMKTGKKKWGYSN